MPNQNSSRLVPAALMLAGVLGASLFPLFVDYVPRGSPLLFAGGIALGAFVGVVIYLFLFHKALIGDRSIRMLLIRRTLFWKYLSPTSRTVSAKHQRMLAWLLVFGILAQMNAAVYIWSTQYIDTAITAIISSTWPILFILLLSRQDRATRRYNRVTSENIIILLFAFAGLAFVVLGTTDQTAPTQGRSLALQIVGLLLALLSPTLGSLSAKSFQWGSEMRKELVLLDQKVAGAKPQSVEIACVVIAYGIGTLGAAGLTLAAALALGERIGLVTFLAALSYGAAIYFTGTLCFRIANLMTKDLMINTLAYTTPVFALLFLAVFSDIQVARIDYVIVGASAVIAVNLLLNLDPEHRTGRYGFKALILSLWVCGVVVFLRDRWFGVDMVWSGGEYWGMVAVSATVFILILSFRISRLVSRTSSEEYQTVVLLRRLETLANIGVVDSDLQRLLLDLSTANNAKELRHPYSEARRLLSSARTTEQYEDHAREIADVEAELDALVHSKQHGSEFSELVAVIVFGLITVGLTLLARPAVEGWFGYLTEVFSVLLGATVVFLMFNLADMRRERSASILKVDALPEAPGYAVLLRSEGNLLLERGLSLIIGFGILVAFGALLYVKWLEPAIYLNWLG